MFVDCLDELLRWHLNTDVDHVETRTLEHDVHEVLPDVVHIALHRSHQEGAHAFGPCLSQQRAKYFQRTTHRLTGNQHLRHEEVTSLEARSHLFQSRDEGVEEQRVRRHPEFETRVGVLEDGRCVPHHRFLVQGLQHIIRSHAAPTFLSAKSGPGVKPIAVDAPIAASTS